MSSGKFLFGALVGGAIGAAVGMLLAPRSGVETREMISEEVSSRYDDAKGKVGDKVSELENTGKKTLDDVAEKLTGKKA